MCTKRRKVYRKCIDTFGNINSPLIHKSQEKLDVSYWLAKNTNSIRANLMKPSKKEQ